MYHDNRLIVLLASLLLGACAGQSSLVSSPSVKLSGVQVSRMSLDGQTFLLSFDVVNPNPFPLPVKSVRYNVQLDQKRFASGETRGDFDVPASGAGSFAISVELDLLQRTAQIGSLLQSGLSRDVAYELNGSLVVDIPFTKPIPFSNSGVIQAASAL